MVPTATQTKHKNRSSAGSSPLFFPHPDIANGRVVAEMTRRLAEKRIGAKKAFLNEVLKEVRVRGSNVTLTYKLPLQASESKLFTVLGLVEAASQCKEPLLQVSFNLS